MTANQDNKSSSHNFKRKKNNPTYPCSITHRRRLTVGGNLCLRTKAPLALITHIVAQNNKECHGSMVLVARLLRLLLLLLTRSGSLWQPLVVLVLIACCDGKSFSFTYRARLAGKICMLLHRCPESITVDRGNLNDPDETEPSSSVVWCGPKHSELIWFCDN